MSRYIIQAAATVSGVRYEKNAVAELTSAQASAITGAGGVVRALNNPAGSTSTVTYLGGAFSTSGTAEGSPTHDLAGEAAGVSNSS